MRRTKNVLTAPWASPVASTATVVRLRRLPGTPRRTTILEGVLQVGFQETSQERLERGVVGNRSQCERSAQLSVFALASVPDYTTLQPFLRRLLEPDLEHALEDSRASRAGEAAKANHGGRRCHRACPRRGEHVLSAAHVSPHPAALPWLRWLNWSAVVDVERQLILSQSARQAPGNSSVVHLGPLSHQG